MIKYTQVISEAR